MLLPAQGAEPRGQFGKKVGLPSAVRADANLEDLHTSDVPEMEYLHGTKNVSNSPYAVQS